MFELFVGIAIGCVAGPVLVSFAKSMWGKVDA